MKRSRRRRTSLWFAIAALALLLAAFGWFNDNFELVRIWPGELLSRSTDRPCTVLWANYYRPCSVRIALALSRVGLEDRTIVLVDVDPRPQRRFRAAKARCSTRRVEHIGNANTMLYFADGSLWFLFEQYKNIAAHGMPRLDVNVGDGLWVCSDGGMATIRDRRKRTFLASLVEAHHDRS